jgi:hypothetical protein
MEERPMAPMLDCLVSYYGLDEYGRPSDWRYFCYHVLAGPGPTPGSGAAAVVTVAVYDESKRCTYCQNFHRAEAGGPAAALGAALRYLDAYHGSDRLWKVLSSIRGLRGEPPRGAAPPQEAAARAVRDLQYPKRKE